MPMDFSDMRSLEMVARVHKFRAIDAHETEDEYRNALSDHVAPIDFIESQEIRNKKGWDQWSDDENKDMLRRVRTSNTKGGKTGCI